MRYFRMIVMVLGIISAPGMIFLTYLRFHGEFASLEIREPALILFACGFLPVLLTYLLVVSLEAQYGRQRTAWQV